MQICPAIPSLSSNHSGTGQALNMTDCKSWLHWLTMNEKHDWWQLQHLTAVIGFSRFLLHLMVFVWMMKLFGWQSHFVSVCLSAPLTHANVAPTSMLAAYMASCARKLQAGSFASANQRRCSQIFDCSWHAGKEGASRPITNGWQASEWEVLDLLSNWQDTGVGRHWRQHSG